MEQSAQTHRQHIEQVMSGKAPAQTNDYWFMNAADTQAVAPGMATFDHNPLVTPGEPSGVASGPQTDVEAALLDKIHSEKGHVAPENSHLKTIQPISNQPVPAKAAAEPPTLDPATKARLARDNNLNISTIAHEAERDLDDGEVVINLH